MRLRIAPSGMLLLLSAVMLAAVQNGNDLYQQGLARETAGDINGAIQIFERIVRDFSSDRALTARALVQLGRWSDLLGQDQARAFYERVILEFPDQMEAAAEARARLDVLVKVAAPDASPARRLVVDWQEWNRRMENLSRRVTGDGHHMVRYNGEQRAFEEVEISTGNVRRLTSDGPNPGAVSVAPDAIELTADRQRLAAAVRVLKGPPADGQTPEAERVELRVFEVGGRGPGRALAAWDAQAGTEPEVYPIAWSLRDDRIWLWIVPGDGSAQIASVDMDGELQVLKSLPWAGSTQVGALSPDGRLLAYHNAVDRQSPTDIYIIASDGSREQRLEHPAADSKPVFLPDGSGIVFESNRRGFRDLWFQALEEGGPAGEPRLVWQNIGYYGAVDRFTDTGSLVYYFLVNDLATHVVPFDHIAAGEPVGEATRLAPIVNEPNSGPAFSPDGLYLAHFRANATRVVIRDLGTGREREFPLGAALGASYARLDWCQSGESLIATGYVNGTGYVTHRVSVKDASVQRLPISAVSWPSPLCVGDGEEIIYVPPLPAAAAGGNMIVRRSLASGRETVLFNGTVTALARSTDGSRLAFVTVSPSGGEARLFTMPSAGGEVSQPLMSSGSIRQGAQTYPLMAEVAWMPSGDALLVVRGDERPLSVGAPPTAALWEVPLTGAAPRKMGALPPARAPGPGAGSFTVHPGGELLAFHLNEGRLQQTWAIDNLFQFIRAGGGW